MWGTLEVSINVMIELSWREGDEVKGIKEEACAPPPPPPIFHNRSPAC